MLLDFCNAVSYEQVNKINICSICEQPLALETINSFNLKSIRCLNCKWHLGFWNIGKPNELIMDYLSYGDYMFHLNHLKKLSNLEELGIYYPNSNIWIPLKQGFTITLQEAYKILNSTKIEMMMMLQ